MKHTYKQLLKLKVLIRRLRNNVADKKSLPTFPSFMCMPEVVCHLRLYCLSLVISFVHWLVCLFVLFSSSYITGNRYCFINSIYICLNVADRFNNSSNILLTLSV